MCRFTCLRVDKVIDVGILRFVTLNKIQPAFLKLNANNNFSAITYLTFEVEEIKLVGESDDFSIVNISEILLHLFNPGERISIKYTGRVDVIILNGKTI